MHNDAPLSLAGLRSHLGLRPTIKQQAVIDACAAGADVVLEAGAGTGMR